MKEFFGTIVFLIIGIVALMFGSFYAYQYFAPRYTAVDNKVFHESQAYNDGMVRDLENLKLDYINADAAHKDAIRAITLHRFSVYPRDRMPADLRNFYEQLESGK